MKLLLIAIAALLALATAAASSKRQPPSDSLGTLFREPPPPPITNPTSRLVLERWITQKLDHFDETNTATWQMRYLSNSDFYRKGGPLFIFVGGEWTATYGWVMGGHMYDMAKEMNGYIFYTEHRYYGQSLPTSDASTENLKYLDVNQALADLAHFIDYQRETIDGAKYSGVILVGASYSATMVAWFKQAYPDKVNGVWASSAPLFAKADFFEYKEVVALAIRSVGGDACADRIQRAVLALEADVDAGDFTRVNTAFNLCDPITSSASALDIASFFSSISNRFSGIVQYHQSPDIENMCEAILTSSITDDVEALASFIRGTSSNCYDIGYQSFVDYYSDTEWGSGATNSEYRQWFFQTCNEFGWYQTSNSPNHIFGTKFTVDLYASMCAALYDNQFTLESIRENILATNNRHNGFVPEVENVFFTHGEHDPWRPMGVQEDLKESAPAVVLRGHAHCQDLNSISDSDTEQMRNTKLQVTATVRKWLNMS